MITSFFFTFALVFSFPFFWRCMNSYLEFFGCKCRRRDNKLVQQKYNIPKQMYYMKPYRITNFFSVLRTKPFGQSFTSLNLMPIFSNPISPIWKEFQPICRPARLKESSWNNQGFHIHVLVINRSSAGSILSSIFFSLVADLISMDWILYILKSCIYESPILMWSSIM